MQTYDEADLQSAIGAGVLAADTADAFRSHVAARRSVAVPAVDEEHFRLVTGFNDIFVTIACVLVIFAARRSDRRWRPPRSVECSWPPPPG